MRWIRILPIALAGLVLAAPGPAPVAKGAPGKCKQPHAPVFKLEKPRKPSCAIGGSCTRRQLEAYDEEVRDFRRALHFYGEELDLYYKRANKFLGCMSELD